MDRAAAPRNGSFGSSTRACDEYDQDDYGYGSTYRNGLGGTNPFLNKTNDYGRQITLMTIVVQGRNHQLQLLRLGPYIERRQQWRCPARQDHRGIL